MYRAANYRWRTGSNFELALGVTAKDIVQEVIEKTMNGTRQWDPNKGELLPWLMDQIKSVVDNLAESAAHRRELHVLQKKEEPTKDDEETLSALNWASETQNPTPEEEILKEEDRKRAETLVGGLFEAVARKPELEAVLEVVMAGCEPKPQPVADELATPVEEIYNRFKRLRRYALKVQELYDQKKTP